MKKRKPLSGAKWEDKDQIRVRIYPDELELVNKTRDLWNSAIQSGVDPREVKHAWIKGDNSYFTVNHLYKKPEERALDDTFLKVVDDIKKWAPEIPKVVRKKCKDPHMLVLDPADVHIGKLSRSFETGEEYNEQIAVQRVKAGVSGVLDKTSGYNLERILLVGGNDILHIDTPNRTTSKGTPQDTDGMWYDNFLTALELYKDTISTLIAIAPVHFVYNPSNHDYMSGFMLAQTLDAYFSKCSDYTSDTSIQHRKYFVYHENVIGTTHGDGAKQQDLPLLMANDCTDWSRCKKRYIYTHHVHHYSAKDYPGVTVESMRSPSGTDSYHHKNGYQHSPKAISGYLHHPTHGQVAKFTHYF